MLDTYDDPYSPPSSIYDVSSPIHDAVREEDLDRIKCFVEKGYNINGYDELRTTPFHVACAIGNVEIVKYMISEGAWINAPTGENSTPLCEASSYGHLDCVKVLVEAGAEINPPLIFSDPLHGACLAGHIGIVQYLLAYGADVKVSDLQHGTALHSAVARPKNNTMCIRLMLEAGANPNALTFYRTPLHRLAKSSRCVEAAELLLSFGSNVYATDSFGQRASDLVANEYPLHSFLKNYESHPTTLLEQCRIRLRIFFRKRFYQIKYLQLPPILLNYLQGC